MSDDFETLVAQGRALYGDLVARSWEMLVARTDATNPAAIEATCELQRNLVVVGAEWLALCEQVLTLATDARSAPARFAVPPRISDAAESNIAGQTPAATSPSSRVDRVAPTRTRSQGRTGPVSAEQAASLLPIPAPEQNAAASRSVPSVSSNTQTTYRVFPLILDAAPAHVQLVAMSFNGAEWHPIAAWRRIYQQVIQSLQRSDPERFDTLATTLTMSNGRPLFSRDRSVYMAPIDAGGGWFATGQMPTELILQRLRMLVDWWGLPRESLSVEVRPELPAAIAPSADIEQPAAQMSTPSSLINASDVEPTNGAGIAGLPMSSAQAPAQSLAQEEAPAQALTPVESLDLDAVGPLADDTDAIVAAPLDAPSPIATPLPAAEDSPIEALNGVAQDAGNADDERLNDTSSAAIADEASDMDAASDVTDTAVNLDLTELATEAALPQNGAVADVRETDHLSVVNVPSVMDADAVAERPPSAEAPLAEQAASAAPEPSEETLSETLPAVDVDAVAPETVEEFAPAVEPQPVDDPVNGTEARVTHDVPVAEPEARVTPNVPAAATVPEVVQPSQLVPDAQPEVALAEEFTPPPAAPQSNVRWVKTINGTRLPLRPATDD